MRLAAESRASEFVALRIIQVVLLFGTSLILARALGPTGRAQYALPLALGGVAWALCHLSLDAAAARALARGEGDLPQIFGHLAGATLCLSVAGMLVTLGVGLAIRPSLAHASPLIIGLAGIGVPFLLAGQMAGHLLLVLGARRAYSRILSVSAGAQLLLACGWAVSSTVRPLSAMIISLVGFAATAVPMIVALARIAGAQTLRPRLRGPVGLGLLKNGLLLHPATIAQQLGSRLDLLIVGAVTTAHAAGLYSLALTLADSVYLASQALALTALRAQSLEESEYAIRYTVRFTRRNLAVAGASAAVACTLAYPFVTLAFGAAWSGSVVPFVILTLASLAVATEGPLRTILARIGSTLTISAFALAGLALNAGLTILLVSLLGISGAALGSVVAFWLYGGSLVYLFSRRTGIPTSELLRPPGASALRLQLRRLLRGSRLP